MVFLILCPALFLLVLIAAYGVYVMAFRSPNKTQNDDFNVSDSPQMAPFKEETLRMIQTVRAIPYEKVTIRWVSASSGEEESAMYNDLNLVPTNDIVPNQQWQLDVAFSGKDEIKAGDLEIVLPAYIWTDRDGNEPGIVTVAVPREGTPGNYDFAWKRVGDNIVITNKRNLSAASKYMVQGTFRMTSPDPNSDPEYFDSTFAHQMTDGDGGDVYKSNPLFGVINVTTPNTGENISMTSNEIYATIDTVRTLIKAAEDLGHDLKLPGDPSELVSAVYVKVSDGASADNAAGYINGHIRRTEAIRTKNMLTDVSDSMAGVSFVMTILIAAVWLLVFFLILIAFLMILRERKKEFASLRVLGASSGMLSGMVFRETAIICLAGGIAGIALACLIVFPFSALIENMLDLPFLRPSAGTIAGLGLGTLLLSMVTGIIASAWSAYRLGHVDVSTILREE